MNNSTLNKVTDTLSKASVSNDGVSFKGKSLVLSTQEDCDEVVDAINSCKDMQYLNLEGNTLGVEASKAISKALESKKELKRALWMDMFTGRMKEEIPRALEYLGNGLTIAGAQLTELDLSDNAFGPIGVEGLAGLLSSKACYQLQVLKLNNNGLGICGGKMLADALLTCHRNSTREGKSLALKLFVAGRNRLENKGAAELAKVFQTLGTLEEISMPQNGIYHKGIKALSDSFKKNPNLKVLDLNDNTITKKGAKHIASALPHLQQLKVLNLGDCLLRTGGATVLANALADRHINLEELHLGCNDIKSDGGLAVVKAMTNKSKLKELNVNGNMFGSDGRQLLKDALVRNQKLYTLGGLSDDESCDEDESDETSDEENEGSEEENAKSEPETNGYNPVNEINVNGTEFNFSESKTTLKDPSTILNNLVENLSIKAKPVGPLATFLDSPTVENFTQVKADKIYEFIDINKDSSVDFYVETFIPMLAKISSLSCCNNKEVVKLSSEISKTMYKDLFAWASEKNQLSTVNNVLFVHLGLIKSEDKKFKINWDIKGSLSALKTATSEGKVPTATQDTLKCFMDRETSKQICEEIIDCVPVKNVNTKIIKYLDYEKFIWKLTVQLYPSNVPPSEGKQIKWLESIQ